MRLYGQEVHTLSEHVRKFCLKQGNVKQTSFLRQMEFAAWAWKDIFRTTIWEISTAVLRVDPKTHTIKLPGDCERMLNISVVDKFGQTHPLTFNPALNTAQILCEKPKCTCSECEGENTLCGAIDAMSVTQEQIEVNGQTYTEVTYIRNNRCGELQKEVHTWAYNPTTDAAEEVITREVLCNVEVTDKGCIAVTSPNIAVLRDNCGYDGSRLNNLWTNSYMGYVNPYRENIPIPFNFYGFFNWNAADRDIIHIFRSKIRRSYYVNDPERCNNECHGEENDIRQVIVSYQSNGSYSEGTEILIPEYATHAVDVGMLYQQDLFNPRSMDRGGAMSAKYSKEKRRVAQYLNPVRLDDIRKLQTQRTTH